MTRKQGGDSDEDANATLRRRSSQTASQPVLPTEARLVTVVGADVGRSHLVRNTTLIGRAEDCDVIVDSSRASRHHARITLADDGEYRIEDLASRNGTQVNGMAIGQHRLQLGDRVHIGTDVVLLFTHRDPLDDRLAQLGRMDAIGQLAAGVAHDFNNLLGVIVANIEYLRGVPAGMAMGDPEVRESLYDARQAVRQATELAEQLLTFAKPPSREKKSLHVEGVVEEVVKLLRRTLDYRIQVNSAATGELAIIADRGQLVQVLMNLGLNARDAMPKGGALTIAAGLASPEELTALPLDALVAHVRIDVVDTGLGMSEDTRQRIFEPFFTTKSKGEGTGLGLSTTYAVVRDHGGHVEVDSAPGQGTTFRLYFPEVRASKPQRARLDTRGDSLPSRGPVNRGAAAAKVLVVDDDALVLRSTERLLRQGGYDVVTACGGREAVALARQHLSEIATVLLDLSMPGLGGEETHRALRTLNPHLPVVVYSGYWTQETQKRMTEAGVVDFVRKPCDGKNLRRVLDGILPPAVLPSSDPSEETIS